MNESLPEELLSAYLDGELPSDERSHVEQWLAESDEHRRLYDDLLALRREIQALPAQSLDAGFSDRVLAAIRSRTEPARGSRRNLSPSPPLRSPNHRWGFPRGDGFPRASRPRWPPCYWA